MDVLASLLFFLFFFFRNAAIFSPVVFAFDLRGRVFGDDVDDDVSEREKKKKGREK